jgi:hypothetical protein
MTHQVLVAAYYLLSEQNLECAWNNSMSMINNSMYSSFILQLFRPPQFAPGLQLRLPFSPNLQHGPGLGVPPQLPTNPGI